MGKEDKKNIEIKRQVDKKHYDFLKYNVLSRWNSYHYQIKEILETKANSVLEIGSGSNILKNILKDNTLNYFSCDIAEDLNPDYLQSVDNMKINKTFDVVCAFQVLEHLPFDKFEKSLVNMKNHSNKYVLISLPDCRPSFSFKLKIPKLKGIRIIIKFPYHRKIIFNGEHYWEFGGKDTPPRKVLKIINKHFEIKRRYVLFENPYHHMFVLEKK